MIPEYDDVPPWTGGERKMGLGHDAFDVLVPVCVVILLVVAILLWGPQ